MQAPYRFYYIEGYGYTFSMTSVLTGTVAIASVLVADYCTAASYLERPIAHQCRVE
jgi:hypothetical protein